MRGKKRLSPFEELMRYIDMLMLSNEKTFLETTDINHDFFLGTATALQAVYKYGIAIYNRKPVSKKFIELDINDPEWRANFDLKKGN